MRIKHDVNDLFGGVWASPDRDARILAIYDEHNRHVKEIVPADRLLLWGPQDGWEPICKFLNLPQPEGPVPYINEVRMPPLTVGSRLIFVLCLMVNRKRSSSAT